MITAGPYHELREGWAKLTFNNWGWMRPHYWKRVDLTEDYQSLCGLRGRVAKTIPTKEYPRGQRVIFHPGDFLTIRCKKCSAKRSKVVA